jgi:glycerol-3-phosphate acyltransferase PlsY
VSAPAVQLFLAALLPIAFFLGSVPFGYFIGKARGVDVRAAGSGNVGATNVGRALGKRYFYLVLLLDAGKAFVPSAIASGVVLANLDAGDRSPATLGLWIGVGVAAMLGHIFSPFLRFKGGKGVACGLGLVLGVFPYLTLPGLTALLVFVGVFLSTRFVSLGSMIAAVVLPVAYVGFMWLRGGSVSTEWPALGLLSLVSALVLWRHRTNVKRLLNGTEIRT